MTSYNRLFTHTFSAAVVFILTACTQTVETQKSAIKSVSCSTSSINVQCILENAETTLNLINTPFNWITSAAELAIAYSDSNQHKKAWALLNSAKNKLPLIKDTKQRNTAASDIALALSQLNPSPKGLAFIKAFTQDVLPIKNTDKQADIYGKLLVAQAVHGEVLEAINNTKTYPTQSETQDAFKGRTLRGISAEIAKNNDFTKAIEVAKSINSTFTYYAAVAHTDIASQAIKTANLSIAINLLDVAEGIGRAQDNGYFEAGILRDVGYNYVKLNNVSRAQTYFYDARQAAKNAKSFQEKARSTSRIATKLADCGLLNNVPQILEEAIIFAKQEKSPVMKNYSLYEIAGSASFSGQFALAKKLIATIPDKPFGSANSLKGAAKRDLAWGKARYGKLQEGINTANSIVSKREKVHALSRIVMLINRPKMLALPRYL